MIFTFSLLLLLPPSNLQGLAMTKLYLWTMTVLLSFLSVSTIVKAFLGNVDW